MDLKENFIRNMELKEIFVNTPDSWHVLQLGDTEEYCAYKGERLSRLEILNKLYAYERHNNIDRYAWCCQEQFFVGSHSELTKIMQELPVHTPDGWHVETEDESFIVICKLSKADIRQIKRERPSCTIPGERYVAYRAEELMDSDKFYEHLLFYLFPYQKTPSNHNKTFVITTSYDAIALMISL